MKLEMKNRIKYILYKYQNIPAPAKAAIWFTICNIFQKGLSLLATPIFTRLMTTSQYGTYTIFQSWYFIISVFATLNLYSGVLNNGLTQYKKDKNELLISFQSLASIATIIIFIIYIFNTKFWNCFLELPTALVIVLFIQLFFEPAFLFWSVEQRYDYKYKWLVIITVAMSIISIFIGIISVLLVSHKEYARIISFSGVTIIVGLFFYFGNIFSAHKVISKKYWGMALKFSLPLVPHYLASNLLNQVDRIMISKMIGKDEAAIYGIAYTLSMMMMMVVNAIGNSYIPFVYKALKEKVYEKIRSITNFLIVFVGIIVISSIAIGPELLKIFASGEYYEAKWIIPPVAMSVLFCFLYTVYGNIEFYFSKTIFVMIASISVAVINIFLNYIFINIFGFIAAGYTTLVSYILFALFHFLFSRFIIQSEKIEKVFDDKFILLFSCISVFLMLVFVLLYSWIIPRYLILFVTMLIVVVKRKYIYNCLKTLKDI